MINIKTILCPVDFFPASDAAVNYAAGLAARYDAAVHLLHVVTPVAAGTYEYAIDTTDIMRSIQKRSMDEINELLARIKRTGIAAQSELRVGDVYQEIKAAIDDLSPDLIVMGTHGRRGVERWFLGSTTEKLLRHTPVPLVTISAASEKSWNEPRFRKILVTTDFSDGTPDALSYAFSVAQENESLVVLLHVIQDMSADDLSGKYRDSLTRWSPKAARGSRSVGGDQLVRHCDSCGDWRTVSHHPENNRRREARLARHEHSWQEHAGSRPAWQHCRTGRPGGCLPGNDDSADKTEVEKESAAGRKSRRLLTSDYCVRGAGCVG